MQTSDQNDKYRESLTEKIKELESLLASKKSEKKAVPVLDESAGDKPDDTIDVPILDELVTDDDYSQDTPEHADISGRTAEQLKQLIEDIEHKLTDELETLVNTLKTTMKESILDELKTRLEEQVDVRNKQSHHTADSAQDRNFPDNN